MLVRIYTNTIYERLYLRWAYNESSEPLIIFWELFHIFISSPRNMGLSDSANLGLNVNHSLHIANAIVLYAMSC